MTSRAAASATAWRIAAARSVRSPAVFGLMPAAMAAMIASGILAARIVAGDAAPRSASRLGDCAHQRPLAGIAVAAAAEDADAACRRAPAPFRAAPKRLFQRIGRVRVVDHDQRLALRRPCVCMRPGGGARRAARPRCRRERFVAGQQRADHGEQIGDIEAADQRRLELRTPCGVSAEKRRPGAVMPRCRAPRTAGRSPARHRLLQRVADGRARRAAQPAGQLRSRKDRRD